MEEETNKETEEQVEEIKNIANEKGDKVVDDLIDAVINVNTEPPTNVSATR